MKMKPPADFGGMDSLGIPAGDGPIDIEDAHVETMRSHGFMDWVDPPELPVKIERVEVPIEIEKIVEKEVESDADTLPENPDEFDQMSRAALFSFIGAHGGGALPKHKTDELRVLARAAKANIPPPAP